MDEIIASHGSFMPEDQQFSSIIKLSLSIREYAPLIAAQFDVAPKDVDCDVFALVNDTRICSLAIVADMLKTGEAFQSPSAQLLPFDHIYRGANSGRCIVIYADLTHEDFGLSCGSWLGTWHYIIMSDTTVCYVLRFLPTKQKGESTPLLLSGYGVQLQIKNQEYKVTDDREILHEKELAADTLDDNSYLDPEFDVYPPSIGKIEEAEWRDVGVKTAIHILGADDQLASFQHISQNFPRYQRLLFEKKVEDMYEFKRQVSANQASIPPTQALFSINGVSIDLENFNLFSFVLFYFISRLFRKIKDESRLVQRLVDLNIPNSSARKLLLPLSSGAQERPVIKGTLFDMRDPLVVWWNNIEKDKRYKGWTPNLREVLFIINLNLAHATDISGTTPFYQKEYLFADISFGSNES
jgi:UDP-glucose:glycoprotein glucosyltransferase